MDFGQVIKALNNGKCVRRESWGGGPLFVCKQNVADISPTAIKDLKSLPEDAKRILQSMNSEGISYRHQCLAVYVNGVATNWSPSNKDIFAEDWVIVK